MMPTVSCSVRAERPERAGDSLVLLIDDDASLFPLVHAMLRPLGVRLVSAGSASEGLVAARRERPDAILLDHELPDATAPQVLRGLNTDARLRDIPVIVVTGSDGIDTAQRCLSAGAVDYLRKPIFAAELQARVGATLDRERRDRVVARTAHEDPLTGLHNRTVLLDRLQQAIDRQRVATKPFSLLLMDFDRFRHVNDGLGPAVGDALLQAFSQRLSDRCVGPHAQEHAEGSCTVARVGGDEFAILLEGACVDSTLTLAEELVAMASVPFDLGALLEMPIQLTASLGVVHGIAQYEAAIDVLRDAEIAMLGVRASGKGGHARFTPAMRTALHQRVRMEHALRDAIGTEQIHLVYQPIVSLSTGHVESVEALVRWTHPELGGIMPSEFIPLAEQTHLIGPLSDQILALACRQLRRWQALGAGIGPERVSVNLSRVQLIDPMLVDRVVQIIGDEGLSPHHVQLEITESELMEHREVATGLLHDFKSHGMRLALDDFGTGYSSLSCIEEFPFDVLKLDQSLVGQIHRTRGFSALLRSVFMLAEQLGLAVVAEGIERFEQQSFLQDCGCAYGQGYLLGRPMHADALTKWRSGQPTLAMVGR